MEKRKGHGSTLSESEQRAEAERQSALESRRRFVRNTLVAGGLVAASFKVGVRPVFAQITTTTTTTDSPTTTTTTTTDSPTTTTTTTTDSPTTTTTTTDSPTTTTTTTPAPTTTLAPSTAVPAPAMSVAGIAALAATLGLIVRKRLRAMWHSDADTSKPGDGGDSE